MVEGRGIAVVVEDGWREVRISGVSETCGCCERSSFVNVCLCDIFKNKIVEFSIARIFLL